MGFDVIRGGVASSGIARLCGGDDAQDGKLVGYSREQTVSIWVDLYEGYVSGVQSVLVVENVLRAS